METLDVDTCPEYEALSYTWGDPNDTEMILVNGCKMNVRRNLWDFLDGVSKARIDYVNHDRGKYQAGYLWIDQISINQSAVDEKNHQVRQIGAIFAVAERVVVWLGKDTSENEDALKTFTLSYESAEPSTEVARVRELQTAINVLTRPYWTRLWIVQECLLARDLIVVCGRLYITWARFLKYRYLYNAVLQGELSSETRMLAKMSLTAPWLAKYRSMTLEPTRVFLSLEQALQTFAWHECADPRDKVYGLLAVVRGSKMLIEIDYARPAPLIFWDVFRVMAKGKTVPLLEFNWLLELGKDMRVTGEEPNAYSYVHVGPLDRLARFSWPDGWTLWRPSWVTNEALQAAKSVLKPPSQRSYTYR
jgi:hypothetical protein